MSSTVNTLSDRLALRVRTERGRREWSIAELAARSGVSKATISKIERGETSPTAALLGRLSGAFGLTLATLLSRLDDGDERVRRAADQPIWTDPNTGYVRRQISPIGDSPLELVDVCLPAGAVVAFPAASYAFIRQLIWVRQGALVFLEGTHRHVLDAGDCLVLGPPQDCAFRNESGAECRYVVALARL